MLVCKVKNIGHIYSVSDINFEYVHNYVVIISRVYG